MKVGILNGPNLGKLGMREPEMYGTETLEDLASMLKSQAKGTELLFEQSNQEGVLVDILEAWTEQSVAGVIINPGGYAHTSVTLRDALAAAPFPAIEVHITNLHSREAFRHQSITAGACIGVISGLGFSGYALALGALLQKVNTHAD